MSKSKKMNTQIYLDFINNRKTEEANQYKDSFIPKTLYKYYPLFDERYSEYKKENKIRFDTIEGNELWVSGAEYLNDPFDLKAIYLDEKVIQERGYQLDLIRMLLDQSRKSIGISCFSNNFNNNMPMWAHYSNNHQGFCMEYQVKNSDLFYPVFYERKRIKTVSVFPDVISEIKNTLAGKKTKYKFELLMSIILLELCLKHNTWKYEQEYRILYPFSTQIERGQLLSNFELDIWPKVIYLGVKCSDEHKQELKRIAETLHCEIYEMYFDDYSADFELKYRAYLR